MGLVYQPNSNVAAPLFGFSQGIFSIGFDSEGELFGYDYYDDSKFVAAQPPTDYTPKAYCAYTFKFSILFCLSCSVFEMPLVSTFRVARAWVWRWTHIPP